MEAQFPARMGVWLQTSDDGAPHSGNKYSTNVGVSIEIYHLDRDPAAVLVTHVQITTPVELESDELISSDPFGATYQPYAEPIFPYPDGLAPSRDVDEGPGHEAYGQTNSPKFDVNCIRENYGERERQKENGQ
jgi:hypothetical protein